MSLEKSCPRRLAASVAVHLFGLGYETERSEDRLCYRFCIQAEAGIGRNTLLVVHEDELVIRVYVELPQPEPVLRMTWIAELVHVANDQLAVFGFFAVAADGRLSHRLAEDCSNVDLTQNSLESFLDRTAFPIRVFERALGLSRKGSVSPRTALEASLTESNARDLSAAKPRVRRAMMELLR